MGGAHKLRLLFLAVSLGWRHLDARRSIEYDENDENRKKNLFILCIL